MQTFSGKVVAFSEEEMGSYQPSSAPSSPLKRLTSQFSKVSLQVVRSYTHTSSHWRPHVASWAHEVFVLVFHAFMHVLSAESCVVSMMLQQDCALSAAMPHSFMTYCCILL